jgi:hypothetical protein
VKKIAEKVQHISEFIDADPGTEDLIGQNSRMLVPCVLLSFFHLSHFNNILSDRSLQDSSPA